MARVILYKGISQYNVLRRFIDYLSESFIELGMEVSIVDAMEGENFNVQKLANEISKGCNFVFSFNGITSDFVVDNISLYDKIGIPLITMLVDNPAYHYTRLNNDLKNVYVGCIDKTHAKFIKENFMHKKSSFFIPHGGRCEIKPEERLKIKDKDIDVLFLGSFESPQNIKSNWNGYYKMVKDILTDLCDLMISKDYYNIFDAYDEVISNREIFQMNNENLEPKMLIINEADKYIRNVKRYSILKFLGENKINVRCYGNGYEQSNLQEYKTININKEVEFENVYKLINQSKFVLNVNPNFCNGSHERIFTTMLNNSVCITSKNEYIEKNFEDGKDIITFSSINLNELKDKIECLVNDNTKLEYINNSGYSNAIVNHTWNNRAERILEIYQYGQIFC